MGGFRGLGLRVRSLGCLRSKEFLLLRVWGCFRFKGWGCFRVWEFRVGGCSGLWAWESSRLRVLDVPILFSTTATT